MLADLPPTTQITAPALSSNAISHDELVRYAQALVIVRRLRADGNARAASFAGNQRDALLGKVRDQVSAILAREGLSHHRFNALSTAVENDVLVRRRVQQIIVDQQIGT